MNYRSVGETGMRVSEIGLGTWDASLNRAIDPGVDFLDTADVYGDGRSETE